jgi:hypothetical protein
MGGAAGYAVKQYLTWYLYPVLANVILAEGAKQVVNYLAKKLSNATFKK